MFFSCRVGFAASRAGDFSGYITGGGTSDEGIIDCHARFGKIIDANGACLRLNGARNQTH
jgi:hypothetical protein